MKISSGRLHLLALMTSELSRVGAMRIDHLSYLVELKSETFGSGLFDEVIQEGLSNGLLLRTEVGEVALSNRGRAVAATSDHMELTDSKMRILAHVIVTSRRDLLGLAFSSSDEIKEILPPGEFECFQQLGLADYRPSERAESWWSSLRNAGKNFDSTILKLIGDRAELQSFQFEMRRLAPYLNGDRSVSWVSRETDLAGYDILSFQGEGDSPLSPKPIEVKSLSKDAQGGLSFFLSRNEFEVAKLLPGFTFHLWESSALASLNTLWIPKLEAVLNSVPSDSGRGAWQSTRIDFESLATESIRIEVEGFAP